MTIETLKTGCHLHMPHSDTSGPQCERCGPGIFFILFLSAYGPRVSNDGVRGLKWLDTDAASHADHNSRLALACDDIAFLFIFLVHIFLPSSFRPWVGNWSIWWEHKIDVFGQQPGKQHENHCRLPSRARRHQLFCRTVCDNG